MSKRANAGELRTPVNFFSIDHMVDSSGYPVETENKVFEKPVYCKWVNVHGNEIFQSMSLNLREPATLTLRYSILITPELKVYRNSEYLAALAAGNEIEDETEAVKVVKTALAAVAYEIISIDNVEQRNEWLEIKIQRIKAAR